MFWWFVLLFRVEYELFDMGMELFVCMVLLWIWIVENVDCFCEVRLSFDSEYCDVDV